MARLGHILMTLFFVGAALVFVATAWLLREVHAPGPLVADALVYVVPGSSVKSITAQLQEARVIDADLPFLVYARWKNRTQGLKAGEYLFPARSTAAEVIGLLQSGKTHQHQITIPEGLMTLEILELLKKEAVLAGEIDTPPPEGSLLPETYNFSYGDRRSDLAERMKKSMQQELTRLWERRAEGLPLKTPEEAVVLASIVERETGLPGERPRVAGVFMNRLNRNIPLQSDPTVIYAVTQGKEKMMRELTYKDLKLSSPYNTYVFPGLPPAPIANPGKASLEAVLNPEKNDYIYFVADGSGGHVFAKTLTEHNKNVARWRALQKSLK